MISQRMAAALILSILAILPLRASAQSESRRRVRIVPAQEQALHDLLVQAKAAADKQDFATASADYEKYLSQKPDDASAHFDLGYVYTAQKQRDKAIAEYRKAVALNPQMADAYLNLGISLLEEDPAAAIEPLAKLTQLNYSFERGHFLLAFAEQRAGKSADAAQEFSIAEKLDPNDPDVHQALGRLDLAGGKAADAEAEFREMLRLKPNDPHGELDLVKSLLNLHKQSEAEEILTAYLAHNPNDADARLARAHLLMDLGKDNEAISELDQAAKISPETLDSLKLRAMIYDREKKYDQVVVALQRAEAMAPQDSKIHAGLGRALLKEKRYPAAVREISETLRLDPKSTDSLRDLVAAEYLGGDYPAALSALDALSQREKLNAGAWFVRATCYDHLGQGKQALDAYRKFLAENTDKNSDEYFEASSRVRFLGKSLKERN